MTRRRRLLGLAAAVVTIAGVAAWGWARFVEPHRVSVEEIEASIPGLDPSLDGFDIVFLADLQVETIGRREREVQRIVEAIEPGLLIIGGDFANVPYYLTDYAVRAARACSLIAHFPSVHGTYAVWGNNDLPETIGPFARANGIRVLENESVTLTLPGGELTLVGLDDPVTGRTDWERAYEKPPPGPHLVIAHSPDAFEEAAGRGAPLVLSGHTHGGQIRHPFHSLRPTLFLKLKPGTPPYRAGRYRSGASELHVSRGIGMSNLDLRFLCPPEVTHVRLRSPAAAVPGPQRTAGDRR